MGVKRARDGTMHVFINGEDQGVAATGIPKVKPMENNSLAIKWKSLQADCCRPIVDSNIFPVGLSIHARL